MSRFFPSQAVQPIVALLSDRPGGNPTQYMIEKAFAHHDLDWRYLTVEVQPSDLADAVRGMRAMGFRGGHCGDPHKRLVVALLDGASDIATAVGAVNVIFREEDKLLGDNTEGRGLLLSLGRLTEPADKRVVLLGAGRAARAVAVELAAAGATEITVVNRTEHRSKELADLLVEKFQIAATPVAWDGQYDVPEGTDVVINATSIGRGDADAAVPLNLERLRSEMIVADLTIDPPRTRLLHEAAERGCKTLDGLGMYIEQVAVALTAWTGVEPQRDVMREAIEEFLEV